MTYSHLIHLIDQFPSAKILCVGDVMMDRFIYGSVGRISPEAPVPVLLREREESMLGGAGIRGDPGQQYRPGRQAKVKDSPITALNLGDTVVEHPISKERDS